MKQRTRHIIGTVLILCGIGMAMYARGLSSQTTAQIKHPPVSPPASSAVPTPISGTLKGRYLTMGDVFWGRYINDWSRASNLKTAYPFSGLASFNPEQYDAWIANLECPITTKQIDSRTMDGDLVFSCLPDYVPEAAKYFSIFGLANNHMDNQGEAGFASTKQYLEQNHLQYFGHYQNANTNDTCEVVSLPITVTHTSGKEQGSLPVALCGYHYVFKTPKPGEIEAISAYADKMPTWALAHMGVEYTTKPNEYQIDAYHRMVDAGADLVMGGHPHYVQTSEAYKGKLIVYSLGNFIFDQQSNVEVRRGMALDITISAPYDENLKAWLALGDSCKVYKDDCLSKAASLTKPKLTYSYGVVASDDTGKLTKKANSSLQQQTMDRLMWSQTLQGLSK